MKLEEFQKLVKGEFVKCSGYDHWGVVTEISVDRERVRVVVLCDRQIYMKDLRAHQVLEKWEQVPHIETDSGFESAYRYLLEMCLSVARVFSSTNPKTIIIDHNNSITE